jgi:hypothetical protein
VNKDAELDALRAELTRERERREAAERGAPITSDYERGYDDSNRELEAKIAQLRRDIENAKRVADAALSLAGPVTDAFDGAIQLAEALRSERLKCAGLTVRLARAAQKENEV